VVAHKSLKFYRVVSSLPRGVTPVKLLTDCISDVLSAGAVYHALPVPSCPELTKKIRVMRLLSKFDHGVNVIALVDSCDEEECYNLKLNTPKQKRVHASSIFILFSVHSIHLFPTSTANTANTNKFQNCTKSVCLLTFFSRLLLLEKM
jgi:hypothetical protein